MWGIDMSTLEPWGKTNKTTIQNELANKPRYDIDGRRYGNTLTDDMISIKNPQIGNRHTPVSYDYFTAPSHLSDFAEDNAATPLSVPAAVANLDLAGATMEGIHGAMMSRANANISRKKFVTDGVSVPVADHESEFVDPEDDTALTAYHRLLAEQKMADDLAGIKNTGGSLADDMRYIKTGGNTYHERGEILPNPNNEWDEEKGMMIDYSKLSPAQLEQLVKMGVATNNEALDGYLKLYKYYMDNLAGK